MFKAYDTETEEIVNVYDVKPHQVITDVEKLYARQSLAFLIWDSNKKDWSYEDKGRFKEVVEERNATYRIKE